MNRKSAAWMWCINHGGRVFMNTPAHVEAHCWKSIQSWYEPELEALRCLAMFCMAPIWVRQFCQSAGPVSVPFFLEYPWGAPATVEAMTFMRSPICPARCGLGGGLVLCKKRNSRWPPLAVLLWGGHIRVWSGRQHLFIEAPECWAEGNTPPCISVQWDIIEQCFGPSDRRHQR